MGLKSCPCSVGHVCILNLGFVCSRVGGRHLFLNYPKACLLAELCAQGAVSSQRGTFSDVHNGMTWGLGLLVARGLLLLSLSASGLLFNCLVHIRGCIRLHISSPLSFKYAEAANVENNIVTIP